MNIQFSHKAGLLFQPLDVFDHTLREKIMQHLDDHIENDLAVTLDMEDVDKIDSSGFGLLLIMSDKLKHKAKPMRIINVQGPILEQFKRHSLISYFNIE